MSLAPRLHLLVIGAICLIIAKELGRGMAWSDRRANVT